MLLFDDALEFDNTHGPLAARMRPRSLDEVVGQTHLLGPGRALRRMIENGDLRSFILWGPPGTGKTTIVSLAIRASKSASRSINAVSCGVKDLRDAISIATKAGRLVLHVEEVHKFQRNQIEVLLPEVEEGRIVLVGTTTQNPYAALPEAIRSRVLLLETRPLRSEDVLAALKRALVDPERGLGPLRPIIEDTVLSQLATVAGGDLRTALGVLEAAVEAADDTPEGRSVGHELLEQCLGRGLQTFSEADAYQLLSALQKSIRGSDPDAALFYLARLVSVQFDLPTLCRRLVVMASEDVGNASPQAISVAVACAQAAQLVGYPEASIPLSQLATFLAASPKSNASLRGFGRAMEDVQAGKGRIVPYHIRHAHNRAYRSPHDSPDGWNDQQYLPDDLADRIYYEPTERGNEKAIKDRLDRLRSLKRRQ